jgi:cell division protein FtsW (lipid II flippase)
MMADRGENVYGETVPRSLQWFGAGALAALVLWLDDHRIFLRCAYAFYGLFIVLLILVPAIARIFHGEVRPEPQDQPGFVPFQHTDFPFAVWSEEHGFVGVSLLMALYMFVVLWALRIASRARDRFGALVAVGVAAMLFRHVAINMGMVLGLLLGISARRQGSPWEGLGGRG